MKTAFVFPGQGAQYVGMGKDFYDQFSVSKRVFEEASDVLKLDLKQICFEENERIHITEYTQAALLTTCVAMLEALKQEDADITPDVAAGLSLGEYGALYTCGAFSFEDAVKCVRQRGIYMQDEVPAGEGAMSAVMKLDTEKIEKICAQVSDKVTIANYNCPGQIVITGATEDVGKAGQLLQEAGAVRVVPLKVSGPFHSPLLAGAGEKLRSVLQNVSWRELRIPYVANVNAQYVRDIHETPELLVKQVSSSVLWQQSVERMIQEGVTRFVEIGPGKTLKKLIRNISKDVEVLNIETVADLKHQGDKNE